MRWLTLIVSLALENICLRTGGVLTHGAHHVFTFHAIHGTSDEAFVLQFALNSLASGVHRVYHMSKVTQCIVRRPVHHFVPPI